MYMHSDNGTDVTVVVVGVLEFSKGHIVIARTLYESPMFALISQTFVHANQILAVIIGKTLDGGAVWTRNGLIV